jgi:hypothetical protein
MAQHFVEMSAKVPVVAVVVSIITTLEVEPG